MRGHGGHLRTGEDIQKRCLTQVADPKPAREHTWPHRTVWGDGEVSIGAVPAELIGTRRLAACPAADLPQIVMPDVGHAQSGHCRPCLLCPLSVTDTDDADPKRDRPVKRLNDAIAGACVSWLQSTLLPGMAAVAPPSGSA